MVAIWCFDCNDVRYSINGTYCTTCMSRDVRKLLCPECGSEDLWPQPPMYDDYNVACTMCSWKDHYEMPTLSR